MKKNLHVLLITCCAGVASSFVVALAQHPDESGTIKTELTVADTDTIIVDEAILLPEKALTLYANLKQIQYDGTVESELYPLALRTHAAVTTALDHPNVGSDVRSRLRSVLLDLDPLLIRGAIYFSSQSNSAEMNRFAKACVDTRLREDMKGMSFGSIGDNIYPSIVYTAAAAAYNSGDYSRAISYFEEYLDGPDNDHRRDVAMFMGQACINTSQQERGAKRLAEVCSLYPTDYNLLMITLQNCLDAGEYVLMRPLLDKALLIRPDDNTLCNVQAALMEREGNYSGALEMYQRLYEANPESLVINRHLALCYYNLGADYFNQAVLETDSKKAAKFMRQAKAYLTTAADKLGTVVESDPSNSKYIKALAMTYGCLGETERLATLNARLEAMGLPLVNATGMPQNISYGDAPTGIPAAADDIPGFQEFAQGYVEENLAKFARRGEFEKVEDFEKRMNSESVYGEYERLCRQAEADYLNRYAKRLRITDMELGAYDADNESYMINTSVGPIIIKVPLKDRQAEAFKSGWESVKIRNPKFCIRDNQVAIESVELFTPAGRTYSYNITRAANYKGYTEVAVDIKSYLDRAQPLGPSGGNVGVASAQSAKVIRAKSDVDTNIPVTSHKNNKTVALIWANENYKNVSDVTSASNDGETFSEYCIKTLGIPETQVILMNNLTYGEMLSSMQRLTKLVESMGSGINVIFYYAGHGLPDEATRDAYLLPIDGDSNTTATTYKLASLYKELSSMRADNVMVFLDACFSGAARDGGMLAEARGVALKPHEATPEGSMFVLSATSDRETALPYREKNHGMFTYYLLKKLQESKGNVTLRALADYVTEQVKTNSLLVNKKTQTPAVKVSGRMASEWNEKKLR